MGIRHIITDDSLDKKDRDPGNFTTSRIDMGDRPRWPRVRGAASSCVRRQDPRAAGDLSPLGGLAPQESPAPRRLRRRRRRPARPEPVTFEDVEVLAHNALVLLCRVNGKLVGIPPRLLLPGSTIAPHAPRGTLVLARALARDLQLIPRPPHRPRS